MSEIPKGTPVKLKIDARDARHQVLAPAGAKGVVRGQLMDRSGELSGYVVDIGPPWNRVVTVDRWGVKA